MCCVCAVFIGIYYVCVHGAHMCIVYILCVVCLYVHIVCVCVWCVYMYKLWSVYVLYVYVYGMYICVYACGVYVLCLYVWCIYVVCVYLCFVCLYCVYVYSMCTCVVCICVSVFAVCACVCIMCGSEDSRGQIDSQLSFFSLVPGIKPRFSRFWASVQQSSLPGSFFLFGSFWVVVEDKKTGKTAWESATDKMSLSIVIPKKCLAGEAHYRRQGEGLDQALSLLGSE